MISLREGTEHSLQKKLEKSNPMFAYMVKLYIQFHTAMLFISGDPVTPRGRDPPVAQEGAHLHRWAGLNILNKDPRTNRVPKLRGHIPGHPLSRGHKYGERFVCIL